MPAKIYKTRFYCWCAYDWSLEDKMLLLLLLSTTWTLSSLAHRTSAYNTREILRNDLTEKARDAVEKVIRSLSKPKTTQEPIANDVEELLNFLLQPKDRLEQDLRELRLLLQFVESSESYETTGAGDNLELEQPGEETGMEVQVKRSRPITLRSRSCYLRLGGHCVTEYLDRAMKQKHYLSSANSPGRKRRSLRSVQTNQISKNQ